MPRVNLPLTEKAYERLEQIVSSLETSKVSFFEAVLLAITDEQARELFVVGEKTRKEALSEQRQVKKKARDALKGMSLSELDEFAKSRDRN